MSLPLKAKSQPQFPGDWYSSSTNLDFVHYDNCFACVGVPKVTCKQQPVVGCK